MKTFRILFRQILDTREYESEINEEIFETIAEYMSKEKDVTPENMIKWVVSEIKNRERLQMSERKKRKDWDDVLSGDDIGNLVEKILFADKDILGVGIRYDDKSCLGNLFIVTDKKDKIADADARYYVERAISAAYPLHIKTGVNASDIIYIHKSDVSHDVFIDDKDVSATKMAF